MKTTTTVCESGYDSDLSDVPRRSSGNTAVSVDQMAMVEGAAEASLSAVGGVSSPESPEESDAAIAEASIDCAVLEGEVIPVDVDIWQYIERVLESHLDAIERDFGVAISADEGDDVLMVKISGTDTDRVSEAHWRFIELHNHVLSRVVVEICEPPRQQYDSNALKTARKNVEVFYRQHVLVKAERGKYVFVGDAKTAKEARFRFMKLAGLAYTPRATTPSRTPPTSPARPPQKRKASRGTERRRDAAAESPVPASRQRHKDNDVTATSGVTQSPTMASQQRQKAKYVTTTSDVMPSPGKASQPGHENEDVTTTRDVSPLLSTPSHQRHDDKDVTSADGMRASLMALQQRNVDKNVTTTRDVMQSSRMASQQQYEGKDITTTRDIMSSPTMASQQRYEDQVDTTARDVVSSPTVASQQRYEDQVDTTARDVMPSSTMASQQRHGDKDVATTTDTPRPLVSSQRYPQRELPMPAHSTHVTFTIPNKPGAGSEPVVVKSEIVPARQPEPLTPQPTRSTTPPQDGDTVEDDADSDKDVGDQQDPAESPMLDDPESGGPSELASASTDTAPGHMAIVSRDIAAGDEVDVLGTVSGAVDSTHEVDYASMPALEPIHSWDDSASSDTESVDVENDGFVHCETPTTNVHSNGPTRPGLDESTPASLNRPRKTTPDGTTGVDTFDDSPKAWRGDSHSNSTSGGIAGGRPAGGATETEEEVMPCYPDESTRRDMLQSLLGKNDPRLAPTLQKLMAPRVDVSVVGDPIVDALMSSMSSLYLDEGDEPGHVEGVAIFEGHDDSETHDDSDTHDDPEKHDDLEGLNGHEELGGFGRRGDHKEHDDHERQDARVEHDGHKGHDARVEHDGHEGHNDQEGHQDPAASYGDPERVVDTAMNATYDDNAREPEVRNKCTVCEESKSQKWFTNETGSVCVLCHAKKLRATLGDTTAKLNVSYPPKSPEVSDDSSDDDDDVPGTRTLKQPVGGTMSQLIDDKSDLPGYQQLGTIIVTYDFPAGIIAVGA